MGRRRERASKSKTLPSSPARSLSSSSSSDFEFTISRSPHKPGCGGGGGGGGGAAALCPADELFYKGQLLPLHPSPRLSMVRTLLLASSSSSSDSAASSSRDSSGSSADYRSSVDSGSSSGRPSSAAAEDDLPKPGQPKKSCYFSLARFSSVFRPKTRPDPEMAPPPTKRVSASARDVIRKYLKKAKPLYEKLSQKQQRQPQQQHPKMAGVPSGVTVPAAAGSSNGSVLDAAAVRGGRREGVGGAYSHHSHSFSGSLKYPRMGGHVASCPSSIRSSPSHSGVFRAGVSGGGHASATTSSSMEELQNAIQGAIAYCKKSSMGSNTGLVSNEI